MSKYTTEVRFICEHLAGLNESTDYVPVKDVIDKARVKIFDFNYPIFDLAYKSTLETKILKHFYTREIGLETYGLWKLKLDTKMNEIMPFYNKLYKTELIEFNPLYDTDINVKGHRDEDVVGNESSNTKNSGNDKGTRNSTDSGTDTRASNDKFNDWDLYSDTPQGGVNGILGAEDEPSIVANGYLTNARHTFGDTAGSTGSTTYGKKNVTTDNTEYGRKTDVVGNSKKEGDIDYTEHVYGYRGANPSKSIVEFRKALLNIDMMVIKDLEELFFQLW